MTKDTEVIDVLSQAIEVLEDMRDLAKDGSDPLGFVESAEDAHQLIAKAMTAAMRPMLMGKNPISQAKDLTP